MPDFGVVKGGCQRSRRRPPWCAALEQHNCDRPSCRDAQMRKGNSGASIAGQHAGQAAASGVSGLVAVFSGVVFRFFFSLAFELVFFLAFFCKLLLTLFIGIIGSCHSFAFVNK